MIILRQSLLQGKLLTEQEIIETLHKGLDGQFTRQKVLVLIPDHTRSLPLPFLFRTAVSRSCTMPDSSISWWPWGRTRR